MIGAYVEEFLQLAASPFVGAVVGAVVASLYGFALRKGADGIDAQRAMLRGMRTLLRNELVEAHREYVEEDHCIRLESLEYVEETYKSYHDLGGNGSGTKLWEDIKSLPIKD